MSALGHEKEAEQTRPGHGRLHSCSPFCSALSIAAFHSSLALFGSVFWAVTKVSSSLVAKHTLNKTGLPVHMALSEAALSRTGWHWTVAFLLHGHLG